MNILDKTEISCIKGLIDVREHEINELKSGALELGGLEGQFVLLVGEDIKILQSVDSIVAHQELVMQRDVRKPEIKT